MRPRVLRGCVLGSSPLTRGKRVLEARFVHFAGLIPAHAGKTTHSFPGRRNGAAHPRSRGENIVVSAPIIIRQGSSPLTRGKRISHEHVQIRRGLIPAHAGKTHFHLVVGVGWWAHPRSRGENAMSEGQISAEEGSSPLTRGKLADALEHLAVGGLIPAHAGKTATTSTGPRPRSAHPRSRGENHLGAI